MLTGAVRHATGWVQQDLRLTIALR